MKLLITFFAAGVALCMPTSVLSAENTGDIGEGTPKNPVSVNVAADTRFDFDYQDFSDSDHKSGFHGRYLDVMIDGRINSRLAFHLRQRLNKFGDMKSDAFGATDWVYIDYSPNASWTLSGGKQVVAIGGFEYDRAPINIYYASMFWNNIACYQFGVSTTYHFGEGRHNLLAQVCNSPYKNPDESCYAYNLMWQGRMGRFSTIWSTNLMEYSHGRYGNYIALGNKLTFDRCYAELDLMNRYMGAGHFLLDDYSVIGKVCASLGKFDVFAKGGYEHYRPVAGENRTVDKPYYGVGAEYFPIAGNRDLRLHLVADVTHNSSSGERCAEVSAGLMWRVDLFRK